MIIIFGLISILASAVSLYSLLCVVRIFLTWFPDLNYSPFGKLLAGICDPWLNMFRKFNPFKNSPVDISPIISLGVLMMISSILKQIAFRRSFSLILITGTVVNMLWSVCSSILTFFNVLLAVRLIAELLNKTASPIWYTIDRVLNPFVYKISGFFFGRRFVQPKTAMIVTLICSIGLQAVFGMLIHTFI